MCREYSFTGKKRDEGTGLVYFNARFYDPEIGRFITVDPIRDGVNWYVYCGNNPLRYVDPSGLFTIAIPFPLPGVLPLPYIPLLPPIPIIPNGMIDDLNGPEYNSQDDTKAKEAERQQRKLKIYEKMIKEPPRHPGFKPPKKWDGKKKKGPDGKYYWTDKKGRRWVPHVDDKHDPHWDVQDADGGYGNYEDVYPEEGAYNDIFNLDGPRNRDDNNIPHGHIEGPGGMLIPIA